MGLPPRFSRHATAMASGGGVKLFFKRLWNILGMYPYIVPAVCILVRHEKVGSRRDTIAASTTIGELLELHI